MAKTTSNSERRTLPHDLAAEASVLGGILLACSWAHGDIKKQSAFLGRISDLEAEHFYDPRHRVTYAAIRQLEARGTGIDLTTVESELAGADKLEACGGVAFLGNLVANVPMPEHVVDYAKAITHAYRWRRFMELASEAIERGYQPVTLDDNPVEWAQRIAVDTARQVPAEVLTLKQAIATERDRIVDLVERMKKGENVFAGMPMGFRDIDGTIGGAPFGSPVLLLGLRGGAKTTLSQCVATSAADAMIKAKKPGVVVVAFNEDMPPFFAQRRIAGETRGGLPTESISRLTFSTDGRYSEAGFDVFLRACEKAMRANDSSLVLLPVHGRDGDDVGRRLLRLHAEFGLIGAVVDYLQRMRSPRGVNNKVEAIGLNMAAMGDVAQETGCAMIVNAQLDPGISERKWDDGGPIPRLGDTRWSKDPEGDARLVLAIFDRWAHGKPSASGGRTDPQPGRDGEQLRRDVVELHCLKRTMGDSELWWRLQWIRESHLIRDLPPNDVGTPQMALDPDEYWRRNNKPDEGRGDVHR